MINITTIDWYNQDNRECNFYNIDQFKKRKFNFAVNENGYFMNCDLEKSSWKSSSLAHSTFIRCNLKKVNFDYSDLEKVIFYRCNLEGVNFWRSNLKNCAFISCKLPTGYKKIIMIIEIMASKLRNKLGLKWESYKPYSL